MISYAYVWHHEQLAGREEGAKDRPCVVVLAVERKSDRETVVIVLPVTHAPPLESAAAIEIPNAVKRHLGLDDERSWIVVAEGNEFLWPGYDLRKRSDSQRYDYGFLPPKLFDKVRKAFLAWHKRGKLKRALR